MAFKTMYPAINNSPVTTLAAAVTTASTTLELVDASCLPAAPNICTIGTDDTAELVLYTNISGNSLTGCTRGFNNTTIKGWALGSKVYRAFSAYDHQAFIDNLNDLAASRTTDEAAIQQNADDIDDLESDLSDLSDSVDARVANLQQQINAAMTRGIHIYGAKWDKTNAACTRVFEAASIATDTSNFKHSGSVNNSYSNPFDNIYPWNLFRQCNVDLTKYAALHPGDDIREAVVAWYGDPSFKDDGSNGFVGAYRPQYWYTAYEDGDYIIFAVADGKMDGWAESPAYIRGYGFAVDAEDSKLTCYNGQPLTNVALSTLHTRANNSGFTIEDIYTYSAEVTAFVVEYATMNSQAAIGEGCDACNCENEGDKPHVAETGATRVVLPAACAAFALEGVTLDFGATKGAVVAANRRTCTGYEAYSDNDYISVKFDEALDTTTDMFVSFHGMANGDAIGNASGYIGTAGKHNAFYRGSVLHANRWRYVLGAYRQTGTSHIWICPADDDPDSYNALNTSKHEDTGLELPASMSGKYIDELGLADGLGAVPFCTAANNGGTSSNPVGDAVYTPAASTANTVLLAGGDAYYGASAGAFCGYWNGAASHSSWACAVLPVLKNP